MTNHNHAQGIGVHSVDVHGDVQKVGTTRSKRLYSMDSQSSTVGNVLTMYPEFTHTGK